MTVPPTPRVFYAIILASIIKGAVAVENYNPYAGHSADYQVQPGLNLNANNLYRGGPSYNYAYGAVRNPQKVSQYTLDNYAYDDSPGAGYGPGYWKGQHTYIPKSDTPSTCSTATTPACSTILTTVTRTLVNSVCVRTTGTTYTTSKESENTRVKSQIDTTTCTPVAIRTPSEGGNTATTTSTSVPCYTTVITQTHSKTKTCTINVQVTTYGPNVGLDPNGTPIVSNAAMLLPVTKSASCTVSAWPN
ncbi:uncharacterized protein LOC129597970 [Paramacrobiotus metropolitanus]|uniref:uncharacterized protein LOC129597970 n=1 Tax=Paramacrobiotus metropolitanus TaxID=2943436 RepID=UPI0024462432|nr:uncharacterized protein LOC129597970 [Paramacrobiotus metropolitanus]